MPEDQRIKNFKESISALNIQIDKHLSAPSVSKIEEKDIIRTAGNCLLAASQIITTGWLIKAFSLIGGFLINYSKTKGGN